MSKALANLKVFAVTSALFAVASLYNLSHSSPLTPGTQLTVIPASSDVVIDTPSIASSKPAPRS